MATPRFSVALTRFRRLIRRRLAAARNMGEPTVQLTVPTSIMRGLLAPSTMHIHLNLEV